MRARAGLGALVLSGVLALTGCGAQAVLTAADEVPALSTALTKVDGYLAHHQYAAARRALYALISDTQSAERNGTLSAARANRIISAARALLAELPQPRPTTTPTPTPTPTRRPEAPEKKEPKKHEDRKEKPGPGERLSSQPQTAPTPSVTPSPTPTPDPSPSPTETSSPAAFTTPSP